MKVPAAPLGRDSPGLAPNHKRLEVAARLFLRGLACNVTGHARLQGCKETIDFLGLALSHDLHVPTGQVPHVAGDRVTLRQTVSGTAKAHTLDMTRIDDPFANHASQCP